MLRLALTVLVACSASAFVPSPIMLRSFTSQCHHEGKLVAFPGFWMPPQTVLHARKQAGSRKIETMDPNDPKYRAAMERQRAVTAAMNLLQTWDEEQTEFVEEHADPNAPLGDWRGLRRQPSAEERKDMREACRLLAEEGAFTLLGLNGDEEDYTLKALQEWVRGLNLPAPAEVPYMCDTWGFEYSHYDEMPPDLAEGFQTGPVHIAYNSKAGADPSTGSDAAAPPAAHIMVYPASDRGVVFTPILEGFFTQYGDLPLNLFDESMDGVEPEEGARGLEPDEDLAMRQHAALGNPMAAMQLQKRRDAEQKRRDEEQKRRDAEAADKRESNE
mmetsp:Transcript_13070/g.26966  ORF Transcript_13070/g.26966 Transcript_13070/m.26966 type:complete len:330 (-) Transcript_13070:858-1847(-)